jgi:hypothetical protein
VQVALDAAWQDECPQAECPVAEVHGVRRMSRSRVPGNRSEVRVMVSSDDTSDSWCRLSTAGHGGDSGSGDSAAIL